MPLDTSFKTPFSPQEIHRVIHPLVNLIENKRKAQVRRKGKDSSLIVAFQGGQGTGKTSLVRLLEQELAKKGYRVLQFSLDDFYTSYARRRKQSQKTSNPFYNIARGMPGTHRVKKLQSILAAIHAGKAFTLPIFDKSLHKGQGDISSKKHFCKGRYDIVLFEGWCLGLKAIPLSRALSLLENQNLSLSSIAATKNDFQEVLEKSAPYKEIWKQVNYWVALRPRSLKYHLEWRVQQEEELRKKKKQGMTVKELTRFVHTYLPLTVISNETLKPHAIIHINKNHKFYKLEELKK